MNLPAWMRTLYSGAGMGTLMYQHCTEQFSDTAFHTFMSESYCPILGYSKD